MRGFQIRIRSVAGHLPDVTIDGEKVAAWILSDLHVETVGESKPERGSAHQYLPSHVFTYYSGKSEQLEALFREHQERFIDNLTEYEEEIDSDSLLRRLFYCRHPHSKLVLLACLLAPEKPLKEILHDLRIEDVDSVLFTLKKPFRLCPVNCPPSKSRRATIGSDLTTPDSPRSSWPRSGTWPSLPIDHTEDKTIDFRGRTELQDLLYLFLKDKDALTKLKDHIGDSYRFFRYVEGSYIADLLDDIRILSSARLCRPHLVEQLSEGELQLLTVLGLMRITHQDECLFLLDEPDTHLNPIWKLRYFDEIEKVLKQDDDEIIKGDSQIIITTHDRDDRQPAERTGEDTQSTKREKYG